MKSLSRIRLFETPWTAANQAPLSVGFSRQEYWSGVPLPSPSSVLSTLQLSISRVKRSPFCRGGTWGSRKFTAPPKNVKLEKKKKRIWNYKEVMSIFKLGSADSLTTMPYCLVKENSNTGPQVRGHCRDQCLLCPQKWGHNFFGEEAGTCEAVSREPHKSVGQSRAMQCRGDE